MKDTIDSGKEMRSAEEIVERLIALRDEVWERQNEREKELFWKINSCLYVPKNKI